MTLTIILYSFSDKTQLSYSDTLFCCVIKSGIPLTKNVNRRQFKKKLVKCLLLGPNIDAINFMKMQPAVIS